MTGDGIPNLIVGRQDGSVEVYAVNLMDELDPPSLIFSHVLSCKYKYKYIYCIAYFQNCGESVTAVQGGVIGNQGYDEILVSTYTGRIFGLTTEVIDKTVGGDNVSGNYAFSTDTGQKILKLK